MVWYHKMVQLLPNYVIATMTAETIPTPRITSPKVEFTLGRALLWFGIAALFTALQIQQSLNYGRLVFGFMFDDDLIYYADSLKYLHSLQTRGLPSLIESFIKTPPHAFGATLPALLGFTVFGIHDWAPSAARGLVIFGMILFVGEYLCRGFSLVWKLIIVALTLSWRMLGLLIVAGRPDVIFGLLLACGIVLITESSWLKSSWQKQVITGAFFGAAFVCKPSMFPVSLFLLFSALFVASFIDTWRDRSNRKKLLTANIYCVATALAVMAPYYLVYGRSAIDYFISVIFGKGNEVWHQNLSLMEHASYYITGAAGKWLMGHYWLGAWMFLAVINLFIYWRRNRREFWSSFIQKFPLALPIMMILTWLVLSIPKTKSPYFGVVLAGLFLLTTMQMLIFLIRQCRSLSPSKYWFGVWLGALGLVGFAWGQARWPDIIYDRETGLRIYKVTEQLAGDIQNDIPSEAKILVLSRWYVHIAKYHISKRRAGKKYEFPQDYLFYFNDLKTNRKLLAEADYVIIELPFDHLSWLPAYSHLPTLFSEIQSSPRFRLWREYPDYLSDKGGKILIYQRVNK